MLHAAFPDTPFLTQRAAPLFHEQSGEADTHTIEAITYDVYHRFLSAMQAHGAERLVRMWNVIPEINRMEGGIETYQRFCRGRLRAFEEHGIPAAQFPAASALGAKDNRYYFGFLAAAGDVMPISNPLQVEAFHYPDNYGPVPPSFARASIWDGTLWLSGTAAIRGHQSLFPDSAEEQTRCAAENIRIVIERAQQLGGQTFLPAAGRWRVYARDPHRMEDIRMLVAKLLGCEDSRVVAVPADICRVELLMEIEGVI